MKPDLQEAMFAIRPEWFDRTDRTRSAMPDGFCVGDGWCVLVERLLLAALDRGFTRANFEVVQVKEKFGGLRFYFRGGDEDFRQLVRAAEEESFSLCERCGTFPATLHRQRGWYRTLCGSCALEAEQGAPPA